MLVAGSFSGLVAASFVSAYCGRKPATPGVQFGSFGLLAGLTIGVAGILLRMKAIGELGDSWALRVEFDEDSRLVDSGVYKIVRHPAYAGAMIQFLGSGIILDSPITIALSCVPAALARIPRIRAEERALAKRYGESYIDYRAVTPAFLPKIRCIFPIGRRRKV